MLLVWPERDRIREQDDEPRGRGKDRSGPYGPGSPTRSKGSPLPSSYMRASEMISQQPPPPPPPLPPPPPPPLPVGHGSTWMPSSGGSGSSDRAAWDMSDVMKRSLNLKERKDSSDWEADDGAVAYRKTSEVGDPMGESPRSRRPSW
jgi:hypothetical protein